MREEKAYLLTKAETLQHVKRAPSGTTFCLHVRVNMPVLTAQDQYYQDGFSSHLNLSRKQAINMLKSGYAVHEDKGARIPVRDTFDTHGVWDKQKEAVVQKTTTFVWIG